MIELNNVSKSYERGKRALKNVTLTIRDGEFVFIMGRSGAGKSTLLRLLMKETDPTEGALVVNDVDLNRLSRRNVPKYRRTIGVVFQDFRLIPKMTVFDNVAFAMRVTGASTKAIRKKVPYVLSHVGLGDKAKCYPNELSGGEQQRVGLARALINNPALIIADEPTGNVDPRMSFEIVDMLNQINRNNGTTILMVTHEHALVRKFRRRIVEIQNGELVADSGPEVDYYV